MLGIWHVSPIYILGLVVSLIAADQDTTNRAIFESPSIRTLLPFEKGNQALRGIISQASVHSVLKSFNFLLHVQDSILSFVGANRNNYHHDQHQQ